MSYLKHDALCCSLASSVLAYTWDEPWNEDSFVENHEKSIIGRLDYVVSLQAEADLGEGSEHMPLP